jgi:hypothetical protein
MMKPLLLCGALIGAFLFSVTYACADDCVLDQSCTTTIWQLTYQGNVVSFGDMDQEQCEDLLAELEAQTEPFTGLACEEVPVKRENI